MFTFIRGQSNHYKQMALKIEESRISVLEAQADLVRKDKIKLFKINCKIAAILLRIDAINGIFLYRVGYNCRHKIIKI